MSFSPVNFFIILSVFVESKCLGLTSQDELTKLSLLDLLGYESEGRKKFFCRLHQDVCQGRCRRDPSINTKSAEEALKRSQQIDNHFVAIKGVFDRLRDSDIREVYR